MSFGLGGRSGSFSGGNLNPYGSSTGGLGQYNIGGAANETAALDKYAATTAWNQGRITDAAYIHALEKYVGTTDKGTQAYISSRADLADAKYTIARNKVVNDLNMATGTAKRISLWQDLISVDRQHLSTMGANDNEQRRQLQSRIDSEQGSIRSESWSEVVRKFNANHMLPAQVLRQAQRMAGQSTGSADHQKWLDTVTEWKGRTDDLTQTNLEDAWQKAKYLKGGGAVLDFLDKRLAQMTPGTPAYVSLKDHRDQVAQATRTAQTQEDDARQKALYDTEQISPDAYLAYLTRREQKAPAGSDEKRQLRVQLYQMTFNVAEKHAMADYQQSGDPKRLLNVYITHQASMSPDSQGWLDMQSAIAKLQADAYHTFDIINKAATVVPTGGGYFVSGSPPPTPGTGANGFASQFDGSQFANVNCGFTAAAMLAWAAGVKGLSGGDMRWYSGDQSNMSMTSSMGIAMQRVGLGLEIDNGYTIDAFRRRVANGEAAIVNGLYGALTGPYRLSGFAGAHSVTVTDVRKSGGTWWYYVMDPIARSKAQGGQWWPEGEMRVFAFNNANNPLTGGTLNGNVMFARKDGKVVRQGVGGVRTSVPPQSFDTDANGRGTQGRGGGTNRQEAGFMPPSWASKARGGAKPHGIDDVSVQTFLGAVAAIDPSAVPTDDAGVKQWENRAKRLLTHYDGDVRLAGAQWFNQGTKTPTDPKQWTDSQTLYANQVGKAFGLPHVDANTTVSPAPTTVTSPSAAVAPGVVGSSAPPPINGSAPVTEIPGAKPAAPTGPDPLAAYSTDAKAAAKALLAHINAPVTDANVKAVLTIANVINGGPDKVGQVNPFGLTTDHPGTFTGQTGIDPSTGAIVWGTTDPVAASIGAFGDVLLQQQPDVVAALRKGNDPNAVLDAASDLTPAFQGNKAKEVWNTEPGLAPLFGLDTKIPTASSMADLAKTHPDIATLMNVDPNDKLQMDWWKKNDESLKIAAAGKGTTWAYYPMGDGPPINLPFHPLMAVEMAENGYIHAQQLGAAQIAAGDSLGGNKTIRDAAAALDLSATTVEGLKRLNRDMHTASDQAALAGDPLAAAQTLYELNSYIGIAAGSVTTVNHEVSPGVTVATYQPVFDPNLSTSPLLDAQGVQDVSSMVEANATHDAAYIGLLVRQPGEPPGFIGHQINPAAGFQTIDMSSGSASLTTITDHTNKDLFALVPTPVLGPDGNPTGEVKQQPLYTQQGYVPVITATGGRIYQPTQKGAIPVVIYNQNPTSTQRAASDTPGTDQSQTGPTELMPSGLADNVATYIDVPDSTDPEGKRFLRYWTINGVDYVGLKPGQALSITYHGTGTLKVNGGQLQVNGQNVDAATVAKDFGIFGSDGKGYKGSTGVGGPGETGVLRTVLPGMPFDGSLSTGERFAVKGDFWPKGRPDPVSLLMHPNVSDSGVNYLASANAQRDARNKAADAAAYADSSGLGTPPSAADQQRMGVGSNPFAPNTPTSFDTVPTAPLGGAKPLSILDIPGYLAQSVNAAAQQARDTANRTLAAAAAERQHQLDIQMAARNRAAVAAARTAPTARPSATYGPVAPPSLTPKPPPAAPHQGTVYNIHAATPQPAPVAPVRANGTGLPAGR